MYHCESVYPDDFEPSSPPRFQFCSPVPTRDAVQSNKRDFIKKKQLPL